MRLSQPAFDLSLVSLGNDTKLDNDRRFARGIHGGPTLTKVAVEVYKRTLLFSALEWEHVNAREFHREAIEPLNDHIPWNLSKFSRVLLGFGFT